MVVIVRRRAAWLLAVPLMFAGSQVAHVFAYRLVYPVASVRLRELVATGHSYMDYLPFALGVCGAVVLVSLASVVVGGVRRRRHAPVPAWAFAFLPVVGFVLQELVERMAAGASFPWWMVLQPTFRVGVLLQLPFALVVFVVARLLLRVAERVAAVFRGEVPEPRRLADTLAWFAVVARPLRIAVLAEGHAGRGPPWIADAMALDSR